MTSLSSLLLGIILALVVSPADMLSMPSPSKRNLFQESFRRKKLEIIESLGRPGTLRNKNSIEEKLAFFVNVNPLSTTTDSNLLEGNWELSYLVPPDTKKLGRRSFPLISSEIGFFLEDEYLPFVRSEMRLLGGVLTIEAKKEILGLTSTSLSADHAYERKLGVGFGLIKIPLPIFGLRGNDGEDNVNNDDFNNNNISDKFDILYVDSDLCIVKKGNDEVQIFTRDEHFVSWKESAKRRLVSTASLPLWILRSVGFGRKGASKNNNSGNANINFGGINPMSGKIRYRAETFSTLQLGEVGEEKDIGDFEDADDPLNHLSPDERQEYIASLTLKDGVRVLSETEANERERKKLEMAVDKKRLAEEMKAKNTPKQFKGPSQ